MKQNSIGLSIGLVIALFMAGIAIYQMRETHRYSQIVRVEELAAQSVSLRDNKFDLSLLLSIEAFHLADTPRTKGVLLDGIQANPQLIQYLRSDVDPSVVAFSPDGKILAVGGDYGTITLWDTATRKPLRQLVAKIDPSKKFSLGNEMILYSVFNLAFSPDGKTLVSAVYTNYGEIYKIVLWDVTTGMPIPQPLLEGTSPYDLLFSPDGKTLAISEWGDISFWNMETSQFVGKFPVPQFDGLNGLNTMPIVSSPIFSPDGMTFAAITSVNTVTFWDVAALKPVGQPLMVGESYSQNHGVYHIAFGQDGKKLLAVAQDGTLTSWDLETRQPVHRWNPLHVKDSNVLYGYHVSFSPDTRLASVNDGSVINVVDIQTGEQISQPLKGNVNNIGDMAFSPDGKMLASVGGKGVILWDLGNRNPLGLVLHKHGGSSLTISPDGKTLAADTFFDDGSWRGSIGLWDITTHNLIGQLDSADKPVTFSPNGKMLATGSSDGVILWDAATHKLIDQFQLGANTYISSLAFSPDGEMVAAGNGLVVTLWDLENHAFSGQPLKANTAIVESMAFSPDGKTLAVGDASNAIILWDIQTRHSIKWTASSDDVDSVAFSPDGETLASTSRDGKIMLWDVKSQKAIERPFIVPTSAIPTTLSFSPDGKMLASGNYDSTINLWNVATRQPIGQGLIGNEWPVGQVAFSPDGNTLATTSNKIILWDVNSQSWVEKICQRVGRNFTRSEWLQYFRDETYRATCPQWPLETESTPTPVVTP